MTVVIIGIILAMLGVAATLYQITAPSNDVHQIIAPEYWWMTWPM